ncbi:FAD-binding oxidoreductase [Azospirillum endophyticum]
MTDTLPDRPSTSAVERLLADLKALLGPRAVTSQAVREHHSRGEGLPDAVLPDIVVFPQTNEEVAAVARLCNDARIPLVPFGAGSSLEGHVVPLHGGVSIDLTGMDRILEINPGSLDCRVQAGVTREQLNKEIRSTGLFFPIDPGANASIGGMTATRASGTNAVRYGTMRENVLGLTVVTPDGRILRTGGRARKSAAGYDLTRLYVGSEGTLGIVTEIQLRLNGLPETVAASVCQFPDLTSAVDTVVAAMQMNIPLARIELLDDMQMRACIRHSKLDGYGETPTLFLEFHGSPATVAEQMDMVRAICDEHGGGAFIHATRPEDRTRLWKARHDVYFACLGLAPGKSCMSTDACVPISELANCIRETRADIDQTGLIAPIVGHVGDGNFHLTILFDPQDPDERGRADALAKRVSLRAIRMGGTCTGEHGIGLHKLDALEAEHGPSVELMRTLKRSFDPNNIMNPGKMIRLS